MNTSPALPLTRITTIIEFWFGALPTDDKYYINKEQQAKFFKKDPEFDHQIRSLFLNEIVEARQGLYESWKESPQGSLALFILLDQLHRNAFRGQPESFAGDARGLENCLYGIDHGYDKEYIPWVRMFYYLPLMHAEDLSIQLLALQKYTEVIKDCEGSSFESAAQMTYNFSEKHKVIIEQFGRFPHRNTALGRESTQEELEYVSTHSGF
jgi:uncharacterized protein (DUF924 family)